MSMLPPLIQCKTTVGNDDIEKVRLHLAQCLIMYEDMSGRDVAIPMHPWVHKLLSPTAPGSLRNDVIAIVEGRLASKKCHC